jgi:hypothetical protein
LFPESAGPVSPEQYPALEVFAPSSEHGGAGNFVGRIVETTVPCAECATENSVTVYRGPQYGLALAEPLSPGEVGQVDLEIRWCSRHGVAGMRLVRQDGSEYTGL